MPPGFGTCGAGVESFMSRLFKILPLVAALGAACAYADDTPAAPPDTEAAPPAVQPDDLYIGIGVFGEMLNVNVESMTRWGNFHVRAGRFQDHAASLALNLSWRKPVRSDDSDDEDSETRPSNGTGYYVGVFGGQLAGEKVGSEDRFRLGIGGEIGRQWVTDYRRSELTVGVALMEAIPEAKLLAEPKVFFSFSIALGH